MPRQHKRLYSALSWIHTSKFQWKDPMRATRVLSLSITLAAASLLANAQTFNEVQVDLPFTITAGSTVVPAGNYEIRPVADQPDTFGFFKDGMICKSIVHAMRIENLNADVNSIPITWQGKNGKQYVAAYAGSGARNGAKPTMLYVFSLP